MATALQSCGGRIPAARPSPEVSGALSTSGRAARRMPHLHRECAGAAHPASRVTENTPGLLGSTQRAICECHDLRRGTGDRLWSQLARSGLYARRISSVEAPGMTPRMSYHVRPAIRLPRAGDGPSAGAAAHPAIVGSRLATSLRSRPCPTRRSRVPPAPIIYITTGNGIPAGRRAGPSKAGRRGLGRRPLIGPAEGRKPPHAPRGPRSMGRTPDWAPC